MLSGGDNSISVLCRSEQSRTQQNVATADTAPETQKVVVKKNCVSVSQLTVDIKVYLGFDFIGPDLLIICIK